MSEKNGGTPELNEVGVRQEPVRVQLDKIVTQINQQTDRLTAGVRTTVEAAREIGLHLTAAKKLLSGAGTQFKTWVGMNCRFSYITACRYVRLAEYWDQFTDHQKGAFTIPELLDQVASHRRVRPDSRQPDDDQPTPCAASSAAPLASRCAASPGGVGAVAPGAGQPLQPEAGTGAGPLMVTDTQVRLAAVKHKLDAVLSEVPPDRLIGFLAELGVTVVALAAPPVRQPPLPTARRTGPGGERGRLFFSYYGGKLLRSGHYPAPTHEVIIEPFAGSAGYATRYLDREVRLYDVDERVVGTWEYLIRAKASEIRALPADVEHLDDHPGLPQEARWLVGWWLNKGCATPRKKRSAWMPHHGSDGCYWGKRVRDRLAIQVELIRHWRVYQGSYDAIPNERATWFVDPPYSGRVGSHYAHKFTEHERLADWCRARTGQVIVCEHQGANWLPFVPLGPTGPRCAREVVWCCAG